MGMFDLVLCYLPIQDSIPDAPVSGWQTKDMPFSSMQTYMIDAEGVLTSPSGVVAYHGALRFYWSNVIGTSGGGSELTDDGRPPVYIQLVALYDHGTLLKVERFMGSEDGTIHGGGYREVWTKL